MQRLPALDHRKPAAALLVALLFWLGTYFLSVAPRYHELPGHYHYPPYHAQDLATAPANAGTVEIVAGPAQPQIASGERRWFQDRSSGVFFALLLGATPIFVAQALSPTASSLPSCWHVA